MNDVAEAALLHVQAALHRNQDIVAAWRQFIVVLEQVYGVPRGEMLMDVPESDYEALAWIRMAWSNAHDEEQLCVYRTASYANSRLRADRRSRLSKLWAFLTCRE